MNSDKIAKELGFGVQAVYKSLKRSGLKSNNKKPKNPRTVTEKQIENAITLYGYGHTLQTIVEVLNLNCSSSALRNLLINRGVKLRPRGKMPCFNENYFEIIDDEHKAYWLGFIYADGGLVNNCLTLGVQLSDREIIEKFKNDMRSNNKIIEYNSEKWNKHMAQIGFTSNKLKEDLNKLGVVHNKTFLLKEIPDIPKDLKRHFIRGLFDGDGTVFINSKLDSLRVGFYGTYDLLKDVQRELNVSLDTSVNKIYEKVGCWLLSYAKKSDIEKIYHYLYDDSTIYLTRKYKKFKEKI